MAPTRTILEQLHAALDERRLVLIERSLPFADRVDVYILAIGGKWILTVKVVDGGYFDGYFAVRLRDISRVSRHKDFAVRLAPKVNPWPPQLPAKPIDLESTSGLIGTVAADGSIFGIEKDRQRRAMWIGIIDEVHDGVLWLWELDTKARWSKRPRGYKLAKITSVAWGGRYIGALELSSGERPGPAPRLGETDSPG
jgi:hypothetical protein